MSISNLQLEQQLLDSDAGRAVYDALIQANIDLRSVSLELSKICSTLNIAIATAWAGPTVEVLFRRQSETIELNITATAATLRQQFQASSWLASDLQNRRGTN